MMALTDKAIAALKNAGLDARKPANYPGECKAPYIIVQDGGNQPAGKNTCKRAAVLYCYAPYAQPAKLNTLLAETRAAMGAVSALRLTGTSEETIDDNFKAIVASLTYTALCAR